jgi:hypothetical protein
MKMFALVFAAALCVTAAPAFAGSPANNPTVLALDVHIGDGERDRDRDRERDHGRHVAMDRDHDRDHCRMNVFRENHDGRIVIRRERRCY